MWPADWLASLSWWAWAGHNRQCIFMYTSWLWNWKDASDNGRCLYPIVHCGCAERKCGANRAGNCIPFRSMDPVIRWLRHPFKGNGLDWRILIPLTRSVRREKNVWEWLPEKLGLCWPYVVLWAPSHSFILGCSVSSK